MDRQLYLLHLSRELRDIILNVGIVHNVRYFCPILIKIEFGRRISVKIHNISFHRELSHAMRTDRSTQLSRSVPQESVLGPLLFLAYVNDICRNIESKNKLFADDCIICRKILSISDADKLQTDLDRLGEWAVENEMKINAGKSKALSLTTARVKNPLHYSYKDQRIREASCCKYLQEAWKALYSIMRILKKRNKNTKSLAYTSLVCPILEYGAACLDPYRECQINALDHVQKKTANLRIIRAV